MLSLLCGFGRRFESAPLPPQVVVQPVSRDEAGPYTAGDRLQLVLANQRANLVLRTAELGSDLADGEGCGRVHTRSMDCSRSGAAILGDEMTGEIDAMGKRKDGLDAFLDEKVAEGFTIETRTDTHAIVFRRPKGLRRFTSGHDPGRFVVEVDEDGRATMRDAEPRRS